MDKDLDLEKLSKYSLDTWLFKQGEMVSLVIHLGNRLGLYEAMDGAGNITSKDLAKFTECHDRWILEWLRCNAAAGLIKTADGINFELEPEAAAVLAQSDKPTYAAAVFANLKPIEVVDGIAEAFKTGIGLSYDGQGDGSEHAVEAMCGPMSKALLLSQVLPILNGVEEKMRKGAKVIDVGCGTGLALELLADEFPKSTFIGYDPSSRAIAVARERFSSYGNVELFALGAESIPDSNDADFDVLVKTQNQKLSQLASFSNSKICFFRACSVFSVAVTFSRNSETTCSGALLRKPGLSSFLRLFSTKRDSVVCFF